LLLIKSKKILVLLSLMHFFMVRPEGFEPSTS
jgi:hypothetical protein